MHDLPDAATASAYSQAAKVRARYHRYQTLLAIRRKLHWAVLFLIFTREAWAGESALLASPVLGLVKAPLSVVPPLAAMLVYLSVAATWIAWQRTPILGGEFRRYIASLPLSASQMERLDRRRLLGSCSILLLPQVLAALMVLHQRPDLATGIALLAAIGGTAVIVWKQGEAVLRRNPVALGLCLVIGGLMALSCDLPLWPRATTFCILALLAVYMPTVPLLRLRKPSSIRYVSQPLARLAAWQALLLPPAAILWRAHRGALTIRLVLAVAAIVLASFAVTKGGMTDRVHGLSVTALAFSVWLLSGLYFALIETRAATRYFAALPLPAWWQPTGELIVVCGLACLLFAATLAPVLATHLVHPLRLASSAVLLLAGLRLAPLLPTNWRVSAILVSVLAWSIYQAFL